MASCEGRGKPADEVTNMSGELVGRCVVCRHVVACVPNDPDPTAAAHNRSDVLSLFEES